MASPCAIPGCQAPFTLWTARFPRHPDLRKRWLKAIQAGTGQLLALDSDSVVCNLHFSNQSISVENYREPTFFQRENNQIFVSSCRLCHSFGDSTKMFHSSQCLVPGETLRMIADKFFNVFEESAQAGFFCETCTVRLDLMHSIWLDVDRAMAQYKSLMLKMSQEDVFPFRRESSQLEPEVVVKEEIHFEEADPSPIEQELNDPTFSQLSVVKPDPEYGLSNEDQYKNVRQHTAIPETQDSVNQVFTKEQEADLAEHVIEAVNLLYSLSYQGVQEMAFQLARAYKIPYPAKWNLLKMTDLEWALGFLQRNPQIASRTTYGCQISMKAAYDTVHISISSFALNKAYQSHPSFSNGSRLYLMAEISTLKTTLPSYKNSIPVQIFILAHPYGERIPPITVFVSNETEGTKYTPSGVLYLTSHTGTLTEGLFREVIKHLCKHIAASPQNPALLVCDNNEDWIASPTTLSLCRGSGLSLVTIPRQYSKAVQSQRGVMFSEMQNAFRVTSEMWLLNYPGRKASPEVVIRWVEHVYSQNFCELWSTESFRKVGVYPLTLRGRLN